MCKLMNLSVGEYRNLLEYDSKIQDEILQVLIYACSVKNTEINKIHAKTAFYAIVLFLNGDTSFNSVMADLIKAEIRNGVIEKTTLSTGNFWQKVTWWNVRENSKYVSIIFGDEVENIKSGVTAKNTGRGISRKMKQYYTTGIENKIIGELLDDIKEIFLNCGRLKEKDRNDKIKAIDCFINFIEFYEGTITSEDYSNSIFKNDDIYIPNRRGLKKVDELSVANFKTNDENDYGGNYKNGIKKRLKRTKRHQDIVVNLTKRLIEKNCDVFAGTVDVLAKTKANRLILFEIKSLDGTYTDEVSQVRMALAQLLYYEMFDVKVKVKKIALFESKITHEHIDYLKKYNIRAIWLKHDKQGYENEEGIVDLENIIS